MQAIARMIDRGVIIHKSLQNDLVACDKSVVCRCHHHRAGIQHRFNLPGSRHGWQNGNSVLAVPLNFIFNDSTGEIAVGHIETDTVFSSAVKDVVTDHTCDIAESVGRNLERMARRAQNCVSGNDHICCRCIGQVNDDTLSCACRSWADRKLGRCHLVRITNHLASKRAIPGQYSRHVGSDQVITKDGSGHWTDKVDVDVKLKRFARCKSLGASRNCGCVKGEREHLVVIAEH